MSQIVETQSEPSKPSTPIVSAIQPTPKTSPRIKAMQQQSLLVAQGVPVVSPHSISKQKQPSPIPFSKQSTTKKIKAPKKVKIQSDTDKMPVPKLGKRGRNQTSYKEDDQVTNEEVLEQTITKKLKTAPQQIVKQRNEASKDSFNDQISDYDNDDGQQQQQHCAMSNFFVKTITDQYKNYNLPSDIDFTLIFHEGFKKDKDKKDHPMILKAQSWFMSEFLVPQYNFLMKNVRHDVESKSMLQKLLFPEHVMVILQNVSHCYSLVDFPSSLYMNKLWQICKSNKCWIEMDDLQKFKDDQNVKEFIKQSCDQLTMKSNWLSVSFVGVVGSCHMLSLLMDAFVGGNIISAKQIGYTQSDVIHQSYTNGDPLSIASIIQLGVYYSRSMLSMQAFTTCLYSNQQCLMSDSVYEALQLCKTKGVQDVVIFLIAKRVDLSQNKLDIATQLTQLLRYAEIDFKNVQRFSNFLKNNGKKLNKQLFEFEDLELIFKDASRLSATLFTKNVLSNLLTDSKLVSNNTTPNKDDSFKIVQIDQKLTKEIDQNLVWQQVSKLINQSTELTDFYDQALQVSRQYEGKSYFNTLCYQTYIVAKCIETIEDHNLAIIPPGMGKTIIGALIALTWQSQESDNDGQICFITTCEDLRQQMQDEFALIFGNKVNFTVWHIEEDQSTLPDASIYIVDEADKVLKQLQVISDAKLKNDSKLKGLLSLVEKQTWWLSATIGHQQKVLLESVFKLKKLNVFPSHYQMQFEPNLHNVRSQWEIQYIPFYDNTNVPKLVVDQVIKDIKLKPIMLFFDTDDQKTTIVQAIKDCDSSILITEVNNYDYVRDNKTVLEHAEQGVFVMGKPIERGVSMRLGRDAVVYVVNYSKYSMTDCQQMIGRGCRSMGRAHGHVFGHVQLTMDKTNAIAMLKSQLIAADKTMQRLQSIYILRGFYKVWQDPHLKIKDRQDMYALFDSSKWQKLDYNFLPTLPQGTQKNKKNQFDMRQRIKDAST